MLGLLVSLGLKLSILLDGNQCLVLGSQVVKSLDLTIHGR